RARPRLPARHERARANALPVRLVSPAEAREHEPEVACVEGIHVASTGIADFGAVCAVLASLIEKHGATLRQGARVTGIRAADKEIVVRTTAGDVVGDV